MRRRTLGFLRQPNLRAGTTLSWPDYADGYAWLEREILPALEACGLRNRGERS